MSSIPYRRRAENVYILKFMKFFWMLISPVPGEVDRQLKRMNGVFSWAILPGIGRDRERRALVVALTV
jgi:hypothetical protein